jgi:hypothetical protein
MPPRINDIDGNDDTTGKDDDDRNADNGRSSNNFCSKDNESCSSTMTAMGKIHHQRKRSVTDDNDLSFGGRVVSATAAALSNDTGSSCVGAASILNLQSLALG